MSEAKTNRRHEQAVARKRQRTRKRLLKFGLPLLAVVVIGGGAALFFTQDDSTDKTLLADVKTYDNLDRTHTQDPQNYPQNPPVGGPHNPTWMNCGAYSTAIPKEQGVHSLEHGAVWITYQPNLPSDQVNKLRSISRENSYVLVSPMDGIPAPIVLSAWGKQLTLDTYDEKKIDAFIKEFMQGKQTPEPGAACTGGAGKPT